MQPPLPPPSSAHPRTPRATSASPCVAVAMSGGVDSSVAAAILLEQGHDVLGITMQVVPDDDAAARDASQVADGLGIPHHVVDFTRQFESEVIADFVAEYRAGRTPNPCARCNQRIKFGALLDTAHEVGAQRLATGHYARVREGEDRYALLRARDPRKDQSYVLAGLTQEQLACVTFPLGDTDKESTKAMARKLGLSSADRPESQEICFIADDNYRRFLDDRLGEAAPGPIVTTEGAEIGRHRGIRHYTIGQRKGLGIAAPRPYFVVRLDPERNAVVVGHEEATFCSELATEEIVWGASPRRTDPLDVLAQIRYNQQPVPARLLPFEDRMRLVFEKPVRAVAPGQWAVAYDGETVVAAGIICETQSAAH
ncbi:MAG: tRNA 2-thiouridine(34) synthase MnmA [bacterium]|nr:tRNA 2-thiouridine(34) synthase MnmA [bacterium]